MENTKPQKEKPRLYSILNIEVFCVALLAGAIFSIMETRITFSVLEKRTLAKFPQFNMNSLSKGNYTDSIDLYFADHFAMRDVLVSFTGGIREKFGYRSNDIMVYKAEGLVPADSSFDVADSLLVDSIHQAVKKKDTIMQEAKMVNNLITYNGRGFQMFGRSDNNGKLYAEMVNRCKEKVGDSVNVFCAIIPSSIDFYLPEKYKTKANYEEGSIEYIYSQLSSQVQAVDAYSEISKHTDDYLYFNTDHHWTALGAYYAYRGFCNAAGFTAKELNEFDRGVKRKFFGSLYFQTLDPSLKKNFDSVVYFKPRISTLTHRYPERTLGSKLKVKLINESVGGVNSYLVFIGGDYPMTLIQTFVSTERSILIIKDSYGNPVVPFLVNHYKRLFVADYRSFDFNIIDFIIRNKISDVLFLHNAFVANTKYTASRESYLMRTINKAPLVFSPDSLPAMP